MNADIYRSGVAAIKWHVVHWLMKCLHLQDINKEMSNFYLASVNVSLHIFTADIIIDIFASDLQFIEHGNIHQHVLKQ